MNLVYSSQEMSNFWKVKNFKRNNIYSCDSLFADLSETPKFIWLMELSPLKRWSTQRIPNKKYSNIGIKCEHLGGKIQVTNIR